MIYRKFGAEKMLVLKCLVGRGRLISRCCVEDVSPQSSEGGGGSFITWCAVERMLLVLKGVIRRGSLIAWCGVDRTLLYYII